MAAEKRTVLVESISYQGADGEDHVGVRGEEISLSPEGAVQFDFAHNSTPEYLAFGEKPKAPAKTVEAKKA